MPIITFREKINNCDILYYAWFFCKKKYFNSIRTGYAQEHKVFVYYNNIGKLNLNVSFTWHFLNLHYKKSGTDLERKAGGAK